MISKKLCLLTIFFFSNFINCAEIEYDCFFKNFVENVFDKDFQYFCITNLKGEKVLIQDIEILDGAKIFFEEIGPKITAMVQSIKKCLDDRGLVLRIMDDNLKEFFDLISLNHTKHTKQIYFKDLQKTSELIENYCLQAPPSTEILDFVPNYLQEAISNVGNYFTLFYEIDKNIKYYIKDKKHLSFLRVYCGLKVPIVGFCKCVFEEYEAFNHLMDYLKIYRSMMIKTLKETKTVLKKKEDEVSEMTEHEFKNINDILGEARTPLYQLRDCNRKFWTLLNNVFDSSEKILKFLEDQTEELKSNQKNLIKN